MEGKSFLDTNIFVYAYSTTEPDKRKVALKLLSLDKVVISTQVVNEFIWVMNRKFGVERQKLRIVGSRLLEMFEVASIDVGTVRKALTIFVDYNYSLWDSLIIASALENGCSILYTEDMQHGQMVDGRLRIVNPFV